MMRWYASECAWAVFTFRDVHFQRCSLPEVFTFRRLSKQVERLDDARGSSLWHVMSLLMTTIMDP